MNVSSSANGDYASGHASGIDAAIGARTSVAVNQYTPIGVRRILIVNLVRVEQGLPRYPANFAEFPYFFFCEQMLSFPDHCNVFTEVTMLVKVDAIHRAPDSAKQEGVLLRICGLAAPF
jgi:hypothetical protein